MFSSRRGELHPVSRNGIRAKGRRWARLLVQHWPRSLQFRSWEGTSQEASDG